VRSAASLHASEEVLFSLRDGRYQLNGDKPKSIPFEYHGSLLSQLKPELLSEELSAVRACLLALPFVSGRQITAVIPSVALSHQRRKSGGWWKMGEIGGGR